jgi:hypothetical protein
VNPADRIAELERRCAELERDRDAWREVALRQLPPLPIVVGPAAPMPVVVPTWPEPPFTVTCRSEEAS